MSDGDTARDRPGAPRHHRVRSPRIHVREVHRRRPGPEHGDRRHRRHRCRQAGDRPPTEYGVPTYDDYQSLLAGGEVDAVVTTVPHYLHPEIGIAALQAGIHALVEKPAGVYTRQVAELNAYAAARPELTFGIMFNQRNNPLYQRIKEIVDNGEIGAIRHTSWIITTWWRPQGYYDQSAWRATWGGEGGGVLVNQAPHQLDLWQWICGVPAVGLRQGRVRLPPRHRRGGRGHRRRRLRQRRHRHLRHRRPRPGRHRPVRDPRRQGQDRRRRLSDRHRHPTGEGRAGAVGLDGHGRRPQAVHGSSSTRPPCTARRPSSSTPPGVRSTPVCWRTSPRTSSTARRCWPPARTASTASGWPTPSTCPAGSARRCRSTSTRTRYLTELNKRIRAEGKFPEREL